MAPRSMALHRPYLHHPFTSVNSKRQQSSTHRILWYWEGLELSSTVEVHMVDRTLSRVQLHRPATNNIAERFIKSNPENTLRCACVPTIWR
jgi:hypothetical protein